MPVQFARREFLAGMVAMTAAKAASRFAAAFDANSPFRVSVINDEISQDFGHACEVASREFGMDWIELRGMWKKNIVNLDEKEVAEARAHSGKISTESHRHCQPAVQSRLAGRAEIEVQRGQEFRRELHSGAAGRSSGARHRDGESVSDRPRALLRFLATGRSGSLSRRHQRQVAGCRRQGGEKGNHSCCSKTNPPAIRPPGPKRPKFWTQCSLRRSC